MMNFAIWALVMTSPAQHPPPPVAPAAPVAQAFTPEQARDRVQTYLNSIDTPIPEGSWVALGPSAVPALEAVIDDPRAISIRRSRAVSALALVSPAVAGPKVMALARNVQEPYIVRAAAMRAAARVLSPAQLKTQLQPVLQKDPDIQIRARAGTVLAQHPQGCASVRAQAAREKPEESGYFSEALERCKAK